MLLRAELWYEQGRLDEVQSGTLRAADLFEEFGAVKHLEGPFSRLKRG